MRVSMSMKEVVLGRRKYRTSATLTMISFCLGQGLEAYG